ERSEFARREHRRIRFVYNSGHGSIRVRAARRRASGGADDMLSIRYLPVLVSSCIVGFAAGGAAAQPSGKGAMPSTPPWQAASPWPDRIVVTVEEDPATSFSVTWRTSADVRETRAEIVRADDHARFDLGARAVPARTETVDLTRKRVDGNEYALRWNDHLATPAYHSVTFRDLEPDTLYAYRVMGAERSEEHTSALQS